VRFQKQENFIFFQVPRLTLGPNQLPVQWVPVDLPRGLSGQSVKVTAHLQLVLRLRMGGTVLQSPIYLYGVPKDKFTVFIFTIFWTSRQCHHTVRWLCTNISGKHVAFFFEVENRGNKLIPNYGQCAQDT